jgi:hypothetical protein
MKMTNPDVGTKQPVIVMAFPTTATSSRWTTEKLCMPCAVKNPDFKERAPSPTATPFEETNMRAWIHGRAFELVRHSSATLVCACCGQKVQAVYTPEERQVA